MEKLSYSITCSILSFVRNPTIWTELYDEIFDDVNSSGLLNDDEFLNIICKVKENKSTFKIDELLKKLITDILHCEHDNDIVNIEKTYERFIKNFFYVTNIEQLKENEDIFFFY